MDEIEKPAALVFKRMDDTALGASNLKRLGRSDVKFVAKGILVALGTLHEAGFVHTGI